MLKIHFFITLLFLSCSSVSNVEMFLSPDLDNQILKENRSYPIEKILIDTCINTTFEGEMGIQKEKLYFIDNIFCRFFEFDINGKFLYQSLGIGHGQKETMIGSIYTHTFLDNGELCLYGPSDDVHIFDSEFNLIRDKSYRKSRKRYVIGEHLDYDSFELYSIGFPAVCRYYNNSVFTNNRSEDPTFNYFETPEIFVKEFRNITEQNLKKKDTDRLLGRGLPSLYKGNSSTHYIFSSIIFDIDRNGNFYVGYMADSLIYKYDKNYNPICAYGFEGTKMDKNYLKIGQINQIRTIGIAQYKTKGYYNRIEYIDEIDYLCRSYCKGEKELTDGLQIYNKTTMIADIDVPKNFKPIGYIKPYLYSNSIVENDEKMYVYRINLGI